MSRCIADVDYITDADCIANQSYYTLLGRADLYLENRILKNLKVSKFAKTKITRHPRNENPDSSRVRYQPSSITLDAKGNG